MPATPTHLPQNRAPHSALVIAEETTFFVQGDSAGGWKFEGDIRGGGDAEPRGCMVGGVADHNLGVGRTHGRHVRNGAAFEADGKEMSLVISIKD